MSQQLYNFFTAVQQMPHWANQHSGGRKRVDSHEEALSTELVNAGFSEVIQTTMSTNKNGKPKKISKYPKLKKQSLLKAIDLSGQARQDAISELVPGMSPGTFIRQPAGSQSFPDYLICDFSGKFVVVEAKSGRGPNPVWNDSRPRKDSVYIMSSGKYNKSTFWLGQDWLTAEQDAIFTNLYKIIDKAVKDANKQLKDTDVLKRGFQYYNRKKHQQGGLVEFTDPFRHPDRNKCEKNVLDFAKAQ